MFSLKRFLPVVANDLKANARRLVLGTGGAMVIGVLVYIAAAATPEASGQLYLSMFTFALLLGGGIFTSGIYADMHDPALRFYTLMLPVSALERFVSRYLLSGPLFLLYTIAAFRVFEIVASWFTQLLHGQTLPALTLASEEVHVIIWLFLAGHALVLLGAIYFRSYALPRTALSVMALAVWLGLLMHVAVKIAYWDHFPSLFSMEQSTPIRMTLWMEQLPDNAIQAIFFLLYCWVLFIAYSALKDHEV